MDKRYQVFVSSTYADLKDERQAVIRTVMEANCIPAGMELFPAADEEQLAFIKRVIDDCDYYLLIIGGRYGSVDESGVSYTEQEYDYAVEKGLKVIALLRENPDEIPLGKSEKEPAARQKLQKFRDKVSTGRLVKFWKSAAELPGLVSINLSRIMNASPAVGWVRANKPASEDLLNEINDLRKMNALLDGALRALKPPPPMEDLAGLDEEISVRGHYKDQYSRGRKPWSGKTTWREVFGYVSPYLAKYPSDYDVEEILAKALLGDRYAGSEPDLDNQLFQTIAVQLMALGLVKIAYSQPTSGLMANIATQPGVWSLTAAGEQLMMELRAVRSSSQGVHKNPS
jgi:hypothetical protein